MSKDVFAEENLEVEETLNENIPDELEASELEEADRKAEIVKEINRLTAELAGLDAGKAEEAEEDELDDIDEGDEAKEDEPAEENKVCEEGKCEEDPEIAISDIIDAANGEGFVKMSCIKALIENADPIIEDKGDDAIACDKTASVNKPGVEDTIGNEASGGKPSVSLLKNIISSLDAMADACEKNGNIEAAEHIDMISNTLQSQLQ